MSTLIGSITRKKKGKTVSKTMIATKKKKDKKSHLIPPAKVGEFFAKLKALAKRYHIEIRTIKVG
jgi:hypothetical protein